MKELRENRYVKQKRMHDRLTRMAKKHNITLLLTPQIPDLIQVFHLLEEKQ